MTTDGEYFEVYKGWIIDPGITMPAQDIHDFNVYLTREEVRNDEPRYMASSLEDARRWIDEQESVLEKREAIGSKEELGEFIRGLPFMPERGEPMPEHVFQQLYPSPAWDLMKPPVSEYGRVVAEETARLLRDFMSGGSFVMKDKFEETGWSSEDITYTGELIHVPDLTQYLTEINVSFGWREPTKDVLRSITLYKGEPEPEEIWGGDLDLEGGKSAGKALLELG